MLPSEASRESERERSVAYQQYNLRDDRGYMGKEKNVFSQLLSSFFKDTIRNLEEVASAPNDG